MNEETGRIFSSPPMTVEQFRRATQRSNNTELTSDEVTVLLPMDRTERVPFWKGVKRNAEKKGYRRGG